MSHAPIPVMLPRLPDPSKVAARLADAQRARTYSNFGPQVRELEARYADFLGTTPDRVVSVANATLGIQGALAVSECRSWRTPSFTFPATPAAVLGAGCEVVWTDISPDDWWMEVGEAADSSNHGLLSVAPFGTGFDLARWGDAVEVVIDAAASIGAELPPLRSLPSGWAVAFSLHATKVLPAGEGGIVVFGDPDRAQAFRSWSNFGFDGRRESMRVGTNAKMTEITAAFAHASLDDWEREREEWQTAHARARDAERVLGLETVPGTDAQLSPYWIVLLRDSAQADAVEAILGGHQIGTRRWWFPTCHTMAGFQHLGKPDLPHTGAIAPRIIGLPMFRDLSDSDFHRVVRAVEGALERTA